MRNRKERRKYEKVTEVREREGEKGGSKRNGRKQEEKGTEKS